jgi:hypothetical protein
MGASRRPTTRSSRPLRAQDRCFFDVILCSALAAAERWPLGGSHQGSAYLNSCDRIIPSTLLVCPFRGVSISMAKTMSVPRPLHAVLHLIADQLRGTPITWAVTGSCSLALQGLAVAVRDIDLRTTAHDAYALEARFHFYQQRPVKFASTGTVQSHFGALEIKGVQVEIVGDMQHWLPDGTWEPVVDMNRFKLWVRLGDIELPVMSLPFLYQAYQLLGRDDKVAILKNWLGEHEQR